MTDAGFAVEVIGGVPVVKDPEAVDITNADGLRSALEHAAAHGHGTSVVDMGRTQFCDTAGLHALVAGEQAGPGRGRSGTAGQRRARRGERGPLKAGYRPAFRSAAVACAAGRLAWAAASRSVSAFSSAPIRIASPVR